MDKFMEALQLELVEAPEMLPAERPTNPMYIVDHIEKAELATMAIKLAKQEIVILQEQREIKMKKALAKLRYLEWLYAGQLQDFAKSNIQKGRSLVLDAGTLQFRTTNRCLVVEDEDKVLEWAKENAPKVIKEKVSFSVVKKELDVVWEQTGSVPPGCHVKPEGETFSIK